MAGDAGAAARSADGPTPDVVVGSGAFTYRVAEGWGRLPDGWEFKDVAAVGVDHHDRVYVFNRGAHPMIVFDRAGNFLRSWGEGTFARPHGLHIAPTAPSTAPTMATTPCANARPTARCC